MHKKAFAHKHINSTPHPAEQQVQQCERPKRGVILCFETQIQTLPWALGRTGDNFWVHFKLSRFLNCKFNRFMDAALNWSKVTNVKAFLLPEKVVRISLGLSAKLYPIARWQCCKFTTNPRPMDQGYYFLKDWQGPYSIVSSTTPGPEESFFTITFSYNN